MLPYIRISFEERTFLHSYHHFEVLLKVPASSFYFALIVSHHVFRCRLSGFFHQTLRFCSCVVQYIPDVFSDPCLETWLLVEDESLDSCGSYRVKPLSSQGRSFAEVISYYQEKKNRAWRSVKGLVDFIWKSFNIVVLAPTVMLF